MKADGMPGLITLWRGLMKLQTLTEGARIGMSIKGDDPRLQEGKERHIPMTCERMGKSIQAWVFWVMTSIQGGNCLGDSI